MLDGGCGNICSGRCQTPRELTPEEVAAEGVRRKQRVLNLIALLKDSNLNFRWHAAEALGAEHDTDAVEPLITALQDPDNYGFVDVPLVSMSANARRECATVWKEIGGMSGILWFLVR